MLRRAKFHPVRSPFQPRIKIMLLTVYRNRWHCFDLTVTDADGANVVFVAGDVIRVKMGRSGVTPILDMDSAAASANGSTLAAANPSRFNIVPGDTALFTAGSYDIEVSIVDDSDNDNIKHAITGVFVVHESQLGDVGLT